MIGLAQCSDHFPLHKVPASSAAGTVHALVVHCAQIISILHEEAALGQVTSARWAEHTQWHGPVTARPATQETPSQGARLWPLLNLCTRITGCLRKNIDRILILFKLCLRDLWRYSFSKAGVPTSLIVHGNSSSVPFYCWGPNATIIQLSSSGNTLDLPQKITWLWIIHTAVSSVYSIITMSFRQTGLRKNNGWIIATKCWVIKLIIFIKKPFFVHLT